VNTFSATAKPLIDELRPAAVKLSPALEQVAVLAPELRTVLTLVGPLTRASGGGEPALKRFLNASIPLLARLKPYLGGIVPVVDYIDDYRAEVAAFFGNSAASTEAVLPSLSSSKLLHYLRISNPVNPQVLTAYAQRPSSSRSNPYMAPGGFLNLARGLSVFGAYLCTSNPLPGIGSTIPGTLADVLRSVYFTADPGGPPCSAQSPLGASLPGLTQTFPHLQPLP
jgi:hypothetical protein